MLKKYPQGSDLTIMNTMYLYPSKDEGTGKWDKGSMTLVYKDNITGQKHRFELAEEIEKNYLK